MAEQPAHREPSTAELLTRLTDQTRVLVKDEVALAKIELTEKAKAAGVGVGLFGTAGVLAWFGVGTLVATAVLALDLALPAWLAALVVALVVFAAAGAAALLGKSKVQQAAPLKPEESMENVRLDLAEIKEARRA